jgi:hypothetical protein
VLEEMNLNLIAHIFEKEVLQQILNQDKDGLLMLIPYEDALKIKDWKMLKGISEQSSGRVTFAVLDVNGQASSKTMNGLRVISPNSLSARKDENPLRAYARVEFGVHAIGIMASEQTRGVIDLAYPDLSDLVVVLDMSRIAAVELQTQIAALIAKQA